MSTVTSSDMFTNLRQQGDIANAAVFLASDLGAYVTGGDRHAELAV